VLYQYVLAVSPAKALPLLPVPEENAYRISLNPCGPALFRPARPHWLTTAHAREGHDVEDEDQHGKRAHLHVVRLDLLPEIFRRAPTISPARNTVRITKTSIPYRPAPVPPKTTSPNCMLASGISPPSGVKESCIAFTAPQEASGGHGGEQSGAEDPETGLLPSMFP